MLAQITVNLISQAQAAAATFTIDDAADLIIAKADQVTSLGAPVDAFDLAAATAPLLKIGVRQEMAIVQAVLRKTNAAA